jgi:hypothetical protein
MSAKELTMGKAYEVLSKWTRIDELMAPYNARIFEKVATGHGRTLMAVGAVAGVLFASFAVAATSTVAFTLMQRAYLAARGIETQATVVSIVFDPPTRRGTSNLATLDYAFETHRGETISDTIRREPWQFKGLARGSRMELLYVEHWPEVNLPRVGFENSGYLAFNCFLGLAFSLHVLLFLMRYWGWRKRAASPMYAS